MSNNDEVLMEFNLKKAKRCNKCDTMKLNQEFDTGRKICKECRKTDNARRYLLNRNQLCARSAKRYQMSKDLKSVEDLNIMN